MVRRFSAPHFSAHLLFFHRRNLGGIFLGGGKKMPPDEVFARASYYIGFLFICIELCFETVAFFCLLLFNNAHTHSSSTVAGATGRTHSVALNCFSRQSLRPTPCVATAYGLAQPPSAPFGTLWQKKCHKNDFSHDCGFIVPLTLSVSPVFPV